MTVLQLGWTVASYEGEVKIRNAAHKRLKGLSNNPTTIITLNVYSAVKTFGNGVLDLPAKLVKKFFIIEDVINLHEKWKMRKHNLKNMKR